MPANCTFPRSLVSKVLAQNTLPVEIACHKCKTSFRLPVGNDLDGLVNAICQKCSTPFVFTFINSALTSDELARHNKDKDSSSVRRLSFHGRGGSLFGIQIVNIFLTLMTLGIYYFWGKVRSRRYLLSQTELEGDRLAYNGNGKELLIGFLRAVLVFGVPYTMLYFLPELLDMGKSVQILGKLLATGVIIAFIPVAIVNTRRYRLSRTSWRGIRFSFRGSTVEFIKLFLKGLLLTVITLGAYYPIFVIRRQTFFVSYSYIGDQQFRFDGQIWGLSGSFLTAFLLTPFTLGLSWFWFFAKKQNYFWDHTCIGAARFRSTITGKGLLGLHLGNLLLLVLTLGLSWPWVVVRSIRYTLNNLTLEGPLNLEEIKQEAQDASAVGEGLAAFLDTGFDFG